MCASEYLKLIAWIIIIIIIVLLLLLINIIIINGYTALRWDLASSSVE
jgi:hypothetical protein